MRRITTEAKVGDTVKLGDYLFRPDSVAFLPQFKDKLGVITGFVGEYSAKIRWEDIGMNSHIGGIISISALDVIRAGANSIELDNIEMKLNE